MSRFDINQRFEAGISRQVEFRAGMRERAKVGFEAIKAVAPEETGHYRRKLRRRGTQIVAQDIAWHLLEFGSAHNEVYAPMRRGLIAAGFRFKPSPR